MLRTYLKKAQDDITVLLDEKRRLLDTVRTLQVRSSASLLLIAVITASNAFSPTEPTRIER